MLSKEISKTINDNILKDNSYHDAEEFNDGFLYGLYVAGAMNKTEWAEASIKYCKKDLNKEWIGFEKYDENKGRCKMTNLEYLEKMKEFKKETINIDTQYRTAKALEIIAEELCLLREKPTVVNNYNVSK